MSTPNPVPPVGIPPIPVAGYAPSASTNLTIIGGCVTAIIVWGLSAKGIFLPAGIEAALATLIAALAGYLPTSGRK